MNSVRKRVTSDERGEVHLEVPVGLPGRVVELTVVWEDVSSTGEWPDGWFEKTSGTITDPTFLRHELPALEQREELE